MTLLSREESRVLVWVPDADSVFAMGEFNNWSTVATPLDQVDGDQLEFRAPRPDMEVDRLSFFVINQGSRSGFVVKYADLIHV